MKVYKKSKDIVSMKRCHLNAFEALHRSKAGEMDGQIASPAPVWRHRLLPVPSRRRDSILVPVLYSIKSWNDKNKTRHKA